MSERIGAFTEIDEKQLKAMQAQARLHAISSGGPGALFMSHPKLAISAVLTALVTFGVLVATLPRSDPERWAAYDKAHLDCRLAGGTYEYFGTQGYACIPAPSSSSNRQ